MANLTDTRYKMQGKTVLYVPNEGTRLSVEKAAKSKEFVQRLESELNFVFTVYSETCIKWTPFWILSSVCLI